MNLDRARDMENHENTIEEPHCLGSTGAPCYVELHKGLSMKDDLIFEVRTKKGHRYKIFLNGKTEGFPNDAVVINHALLLFNRLSALTNRPNNTHYPSPVSKGCVVIPDLEDLSQSDEHQENVPPPMGLID
jgi:hypothetical protein